MHKSTQNRKSKIENRESGQAVVMALLALAIGVLLVSVFLYFASTSQRATAATQEQTMDRYSADAGIEYGIWRLENDPAFRQQVEANGSANLTLEINGQSVVVTVTHVLTP